MTFILECECLLRYQNSSSEFPEQNTSMKISLVLAGNETFVVPPVSSVSVNRFVVFGERLESGKMKSEVSATGKSLVGA